MDWTDTLQRLANAWRPRVRGPARLAFLGLGVTALVAGAHVARFGTHDARIAAAGILAVTAVTWLVRAWRERRDWRDPGGILRRTVLPIDRDLALRALRALRLVQDAERDPSVGSVDLSRAHFDRLVRRAPEQAVASAARRCAWWWRSLGWGLLVAGVAVTLLWPDRFVQGLAVLSAREHRAPVQLRWLEDPKVSVHPPAYLRLPDEMAVFGTEIQVFHGTVITVRGFALREPQRLVLTDGRLEVPFTSDGSGEIVATWRLDRTSRLRTAARFGEVLIEEPEVLVAEALADARPEVTLDGAPRSVRLGDLDRLELGYAAADDHGLSQIDLVLISGDREQRRVLAHLDGTSRHESGGSVIGAQDSFFKRTFLPVTIVVEARDNDTLLGPKWGRSKPIVVELPPIGAPEARRLEVLRRGAAPLVEVLAEVLTLVTNGPGAPVPPSLHERMLQAAHTLRRPLDQKYLGLGVSRGLSTFLNGQVGRLEPALDGASTLRRLEQVLLAVDAALGQLAVRDAVSVSRRLADVAEQLATAASQTRENEGRTVDIERLGAAWRALRDGAGELSRLGDLGADLGSAATADLRRLDRSLTKRDVHSAELIAQHLGMKLRGAAPSFAGGVSGGVEAGIGVAGEGVDGQPSTADQRFDQLALEIEQLIEEHAQNIETVEQVMTDAQRQADQAAWQKEAAEMATKVRASAEQLPRVADATSGGAAAALAREHAESMADALQEHALRDALLSGRDAALALSQARDPARGAATGGSPDRVARFGRVSEVIAKALRWVAERQEETERAAAERAREALDGAADREGTLRDKADLIASTGGIGEVQLPDRAVRALRGAHTKMDSATQMLRGHRTEGALELQRLAQELLEQARTGRTTESPDAERGSGEDTRWGEGKGLGTDRDMVKPNRTEDATKFRQRVLDGLGRPNTERLAPAVRRYAEELLQ